ncbi:MAG: class I SAM-dependent methyltransferase, partial [Anaerolineae bacterium]|nr:class I SAM-dependent methyltransferase [Anaerolineae bacterium]
PHASDQDYLLNEQYRDHTNLSARAALHARFSTNTYGWHPWVFDRLLDLPPTARVLELGCGPGWLWRENLDRIPAGWTITLSDFSPGMVAEAQRHLQAAPRPFNFRCIDAQAIPFADAAFDAVIANHMLYHVPDRASALSEIRRVLKPGGRLFATTIGENHMRDLHDLLQQLVPEADAWSSLGGGVTFTLESGADELQESFDDVTMQRYDDAFVVTEAQPLVDYILSGHLRPVLTGVKLATVTAFINKEIAAKGAIRIGKDSGVFTARRSPA